MFHVSEKFTNPIGKTQNALIVSWVWYKTAVDGVVHYSQVYSDPEWV